MSAERRPTRLPLLPDLIRLSFEEDGDPGVLLTAATIARQWGEEPVTVLDMLAVMARRGEVEYRPARSTYVNRATAARRQLFGRALS